MSDNFENLKEVFYLIKQNQKNFYDNPNPYLNKILKYLNDENLKSKITKLLTKPFRIKELDDLIVEITLLLSETQMKLNKIDLSVIEIDKIKGVGGKTKTYFENIGIISVENLLYYFPYKYETIGGENFGDKAVLSGKFIRYETVFTRNGKRIFKAYFQSDNDFFSAVWFKFSKFYPSNILKPENKYNLFGQISYFSGIKTVTHPEFLDESEINTVRPIYSSVGNLKQKNIQNIVKNALNDYCKYLIDYLPFHILRKYGFPSIMQTVKFLHFPHNLEDVTRIYERTSPMIKRLIYEELFYLQLGLALKKNQYDKISGQVISITKELLNKIKDYMPFKLTKSQKKVLTEIFNDIASGKQMNRLLQGDVGSGKTIIAFIVASVMCENGFQTAIIAPTEVLAEQHFKKFKAFAGSNYRCEFLSGSTKQKDRKKIYEMIKNGDIDVIIGTHAVIQDKVDFKNLGLAIIDEQHRFGVMQRKCLIDKGLNPHILLMTATPIPRTLAISYYGDLDISIIDELPSGRKPIKTFFLPMSEMKKLLNIIKEQINKNRNIYIVYPLIEESEHFNAENAVKGFEYFNNIFGNKTAILHGKMKSEEKNSILNDFLNKKYQILISTTVIEVGIDVPDATLMVIMNAERFGLSQLHQLRGRVGRSNVQSFCVLVVSEELSEEGKERVNAMVKYTDGFKLSEIDLKMRGPGDFFGVRQSGMPELKYANLFEDSHILNNAKRDAFQIIYKDSDLMLPENRIIKQGLTKKWKKTLDMIRVG